MTLNEFQKLAARTINRDLTVLEMEKHALFGLASEVGEVLGLYQKVYQGHTLDVDKIIDEGGDVLWMLAELFTAWGIPLDDVAKHNVDKLKARYPGKGFDPERSLHREV